MEKFKKIVLNIPHSRVSGVFDEKIGWKKNAAVVNKVVSETDWHTDFIFSSEDKRIFPVVFRMSRFVVDVERLENDEFEKEGRGIIYNNVCGVERKLSEEYKEALLLVRRMHLKSLTQELTRESILIDCHSFNDSVAPDTDICIGFNDDWSKPDKETIDGVVEILSKAGYKVKINNPYGNSITPEAGFKYKSMMIEVNKKLYLRNNVEINVDSLYAPRLSNTIKKVYEFLLE